MYPRYKFLRRNEKTGNLVTPHLTFLASGHLSHLLIISANSLDPDQDRQDVVLIWIQTDTLTVFLKEFFEKVNFEKKNSTVNRRQKSMINYPACNEVREQLKTCLDFLTIYHLMVKELPLLMCHHFVSKKTLHSSVLMCSVCLTCEGENP